MIIGQKKLIRNIDTLSKRFPRFLILCGDKGSGKKTICKYISNKLQMNLIPCDIKVDEVRNVIDMAYSQYSPIIYMFADADNMSPAAKNSLLKVTEEPPKNAYFILTICNSSSTLDTLKSRGMLLNLDTYTPTEIIEYCQYKGYNYNPQELIIVQNVCTTTGEVDTLQNNEVTKLYEYGKKIALNIHTPKNGNIFKITKPIQLKESDKGFDAILLFRVIRNVYYEKGVETKLPQYFEAVKVTSKYLQQLQMPSISKLGTIDMWIMEVRSVLKGI